MSRYRKANKSAIPLIPIVVCRSCCVLFAFWLLITGALANDFGLHNPAQRDFAGNSAEFRSATRSAGDFAQRNPVFDARTLPLPPTTIQQNQQTEPIRQVSTTVNAPFTSIVQPVAPLVPPFDGGTAFHAVPNNPHISNQHIPHQTIPHHFNAHAGFADPHVAMQQFAQPQFAMNQFAMQPQIHHPALMQQQEFMTNGIYPHMHPHMMPFANMHTMQGQFGQGQFGQGQFGQFGHLDPHTMMALQHAGVNSMGYPTMHDPQQLQQMLLMQEIVRLQAEAANTNNRGEGEAREPDDPNWTLNNLMPVYVKSPLAETLWTASRTLSPFNSPTGPDRGVGRPLVGKSWLDHPYYFGGFVGTMHGSSTLVSGMIRQRDGGTGGLLLGYNFNDYWGVESRLHFASIDIRDTNRARELFEVAWEAENPGIPAPPRTSRSNELTLLDVSVMYYPLGNAKWRPYFRYGLGVGRQTFVNTFGFTQRSDIISMPTGIGLRYWWNERLAVQMDLACNTVFATKVSKTQNNVAVTMGITYAFGTGRRVTPVVHWPATPSMGSRW